MIDYMILLVIADPKYYSHLVSSILCMHNKNMNNLSSKWFNLGSNFKFGEGNGNPLQYSCLEDPMDRGAWRATVHGGHKESDTLKGLSMHT